jgi:hypothetical protein
MQQMAAKIQELMQQLQGERGMLAIDGQKVDVDRYKAETDRMQAVQGAMTPQMIQAIVIQTLTDLASDDGLPMGEGQQRPTGMMPEPERVAA